MFQMQLGHLNLLSVSHPYLTIQKDLQTLLSDIAKKLFELNKNSRKNYFSFVYNFYDGFLGFEPKHQIVT